MTDRSYMDRFSYLSAGSAIFKIVWNRFLYTKTVSLEDAYGVLSDGILIPIRPNEIKKYGNGYYLDVYGYKSKYIMNKGSNISHNIIKYVEDRKVRIDAGCIYEVKTPLVRDRYKISLNLAILNSVQTIFSDNGTGYEEECVFIPFRQNCIKDLKQYFFMCPYKEIHDNMKSHFVYPLLSREMRYGNMGSGGIHSEVCGYVKI